MESILVNVGSKQEVKFFLNLVKRMGYSSRVISADEKEDAALLALMNEREDEEYFPVETTENILKNILKSK